MKDWLEFITIIGEMILMFIVGLILSAIVVFIALGLMAFAVSIPLGAGVLIGNIILTLI